MKTTSCITLTLLLLTSASQTFSVNKNKIALNKFVQQNSFAALDEQDATQTNRVETEPIQQTPDRRALQELLMAITGLTRREIKHISIANQRKVLQAQFTTEGREMVRKTHFS